MFARLLAVSIGAGLASAGGAPAAESTAVMGVTAVVPTTCEVAADAATARVFCDQATTVTLTLPGAGPVRLPLTGDTPQLIRLPRTDSAGGAVLTIAY